MINVVDISKRYGAQKVLDRVSFTVEEGETMVLLGTSGCGKTTTLRTINAMLLPDEGMVTIKDKPVTTVAPEKLRLGIGYVMQQHGLFPHYTVAENISVVPRLLGWDDKTVKARSTGLMEQLHLPPAEFAHKYPHELSGGQQQRVGVARGLAGNAPILLMDEPFGALDPVTRQLVRKDFLELEEIGKKTIVLVTHDVAEAFEMGDRICLMNKGHIEQTGTPAELLFRPATAFVSSFFDANRSLLELSIVTLRDLWPLLPALPEQPVEEDILPAATTCWQLLQHLTNGREAATVQYLGQMKAVYRKNLLDAFNDYKMAQYRQ